MTRLNNNDPTCSVRRPADEPAISRLSQGPEPRPFLYTWWIRNGLYGKKFGWTQVCVTH
jgi:hypothetical protein